MPGRRTRGVKQVDYRALDGEDSDDDFNVPTPPTKRPRAQKASERAAEFADGAGPSGVRPSLDDKLFQKQLKIALEKSRSDSQPTLDDSSQENGVKSADAVPGPQNEVCCPPKRSFVHQEPASPDSGDDEDDWTAEASSSNESEESKDDTNFSDEEFSSKTKKTTKVKKTTKTKLTKQTNHKVKTPATSKKPAGRQQPEPAKSAVLVASPAAAARPSLKAVDSRVRSPSASPAVLTERKAGPPKWKPPALVSEAPASDKKLLSPSGGGLRIGLSRNIRLKPLHPCARPVT